MVDWATLDCIAHHELDRSDASSRPDNKVASITQRRNMRKRWSIYNIFQFKHTVGHYGFYQNINTFSTYTLLYIAMNSRIHVSFSGSSIQGGWGRLPLSALICTALIFGFGTRWDQFSQGWWDRSFTSSVSYLATRVGLWMYMLYYAVKYVQYMQCLAIYMRL